MLLFSETSKKEDEAKFKHPHSIEAIVQTPALTTASPPPLIYSGQSPAYLNPFLNLFYPNRIATSAAAALDLSKEDK